ncbi:Flagellar biosynthetic protein FliQ [Rickettsiales endosymbiont of Paramecium tredecaurelia]|uniref:flagellar biosynthesis protein FliQ n=1 Tax=Candidatus Sarmatiella mevalonica TaxID=2770581 RepID=UPI001922B05F|nr:flagellar biosynthesis protein FliQ [Candidatus Sarmatiella mevalonica]MBL3284808.1 Flagellar biosynthetic protein FliQ [Candidatus Sarmatiella mevalonica]
MDVSYLNDVGREAVQTIITMSAPVLLVSLIVGVIISLFQALTQIQENTLTFVPKMLSIYFMLLFSMPYMITKLQIFVDHLMQHIIHHI